MGIQFDEIDLDKNEAVDRVMNDFDTSNDQHIDEGEFVKGVSKWLIEAKHYGTSGPDAGSNSLRFLEAAHNVSSHDNLLQLQLLTNKIVSQLFEM